MTDPTFDWLSREGAERMAYEIQQLWKQYGYNVTVNIRPVSGMAGGAARIAHGSAWEIRSDLIRGLPRFRLDGTQVRW